MKSQFDEEAGVKEYFDGEEAAYREFKRKSMMAVKELSKGSKEIPEINDPGLSKTKFKEYLDERSETAYEFSRRTIIAMATVAKLVNGIPVRIDIARKVVRASKNKLNLEDIPTLPNP